MAAGSERPACVLNRDEYANLQRINRFCKDLGGLRGQGYRRVVFGLARLVWFSESALPTLSARGVWVGGANLVF